MKNTRKIQLCFLSRNGVLRSKIKKRKRVNEHPWAMTEAMVSLSFIFLHCYRVSV